jgi:hypothetical protein
MQIDPILDEALAAERERENGRPEAPHTAATESGELVIRLARPDDASLLSTLGQLDAGTRCGLRLAALARSPEHGQVLVAETNGTLVAALDVRQNRVVADPFQRSTAAMELLEVRSRQLRPLPAHRRRSRGRLAARLLPRTG